MPLFEFECEAEDCKHKTEKIVKSDVYIVECDRCGDFAKKIPSAGSFVIHGYSEANGYSKRK